MDCPFFGVELNESDPASSSRWNLDEEGCRTVVYGDGRIESDATCSVDEEFAEAAVEAVVNAPDAPGAEPDAELDPAVDEPLPGHISVGYGDDVHEALVEGAGYFGDTPEIFQQRAMAVLSFLVAISGDPVNELQDPPAVDGPNTVTSEFTDEEYTNWVPRARAHLVADAQVSQYVAAYLLIFLTSLS